MPFPVVLCRFYWRRCDFLGTLETVGKLVCTGVFIYMWFFFSFPSKMTVKWHFLSLHVCLISATMVNKSFSSEVLVLKADFAHEKDKKNLLNLDFTKKCDYFKVWMNYVIFSDLREFPRKADLKEYSLLWIPVVVAAILCCKVFPLQWTVPHTGHLDIVA